MEENIKKQQVKMHMDFFDRCKFAIDHGFYFEAILMEYAAIEGRLEVILGILGLPCNKELPANIRKDIKISNRIQCFSKIIKKTDRFEKSKLDSKYFEQLKKWILNRNQYIHGFYKDVTKYKQRITDAQKMAEEGLELAKKLYNEAKRLRRMKEKNETVFIHDNIRCYSKCNFLVTDYPINT